MMFYLYALPGIPDGTVVFFLGGQWEDIKSLVDAA